MERIPLFVRKFILDAAETFVGAFFAMNLIIPGTLDEAKAAGLLLGAAAIAAIASAARRAAPAALAALAALLAVSQDPE